MKEVDLCYLPTNGLCRLNKVLDDSVFPDNKENIITQELVTYYKSKKAIRKVKFKKRFYRH